MVDVNLKLLFGTILGIIVYIYLILHMISYLAVSNSMFSERITTTILITFFGLCLGWFLRIAILEKKK